MLALAPVRVLAATEYTRTTWTVETGAPAGVQAIAQSPDGFLWLGTARGLYRFDGVTFEKIPSFASAPKRSESVTALMAGTSGTIWVGHQWGGVSRYDHGRWSDANPLPPHGLVYRILQGPDGTVWVICDGVRKTVVTRYARGRWTVIDQSWGLPAEHLQSGVASRDGSLWLALSDDVVVLRPGAKRFERLGKSIGRHGSLVEAPDASIFVVEPKSIQPLSAAPATAPAFVGPGELGSNFQGAVLDADGTLWDIDPNRGVLKRARPFAGRRRNAGSTDSVVNLQKDGSGSPQQVIRDREENFWVATSLGIVRLRPNNVVTETRVSLNSSSWSSSASNRVATTSGGTVYAITSGAATLVARPGSSAASRLSLPGAPMCLYPDNSDGMWVGTTTADLFHVTSSGIVRAPHPPANRPAAINTCLVDNIGRVWIGGPDRALERYDGKTWTHVDLTPELAGLWPWPMENDPQGRILMYFGTRSLVRVDGKRVETLWTAEQNQIGFIHVIYRGPSAMYLGGESGLARFDGRAFQVLPARSYPFLEHVSGIVQTERGETWLIGALGVIRIRTSDLEHAFAHPGTSLLNTPYDIASGLHGLASDQMENDLAEGGDGRIWVASTEAVSWLDPARLHHNALPPPVVIRSLRAHGITYEAARDPKLPKGVGDIQIDYTALSFIDPKRVQFRYLLEGVDDGWVDPGARRQAFYTNLRPGPYVFRVIAANNDGVWNRKGATLRFKVQPTFLQSKAFLGLCLLAAATALWLLYSLRLRQVADRLRFRMQERVAERERIARELHDTFLQSVLGLVLRFQTVANQIPKDQPARVTMEKALNRADEVLAEGRDRVISLRSSDGERRLSQLLEATAQGILSGAAIQVRLTVDGVERTIQAMVAEEITRIAEEFAFNTLRHARARFVHIELRYAQKCLIVQLADDGIGMTVESGSPPGHFGLVGMRERAVRIRASFSIASEPGNGVRVVIELPARLAFLKRRRRFWDLISFQQAVHDGGGL